MTSRSFQRFPTDFFAIAAKSKRVRRICRRELLFLSMSSADRDVRNLGKYLDIEVSVLRGADRSWAVSKARKQVAYVLVRRIGYRLKDVAGYLG